MKIVVLGEPAVGKTTLIQRIAEKCDDGKYRMFFQSEEDPNPNKLVEVELSESTLAAFDSTVVGVIYVIDTTDRKSYQQLNDVHVPSYFSQGHRSRDLTLLISTKTDLVELRQVTTEEIEEFAASQSLLTFECNINTPRSYDVVSRMIRMKLPIKRLVLVRKYQMKPTHFNPASSEKRTSVGEPSTPMNKFSFDSHQGTMASTQLPSQLFNYPNSLPPNISNHYTGNQRLLRSGSRDQLKLLTDEKSNRWNHVARDHDETSDYRLNFENSVMNGTQREQTHIPHNILGSSPIRQPQNHEEDYHFLETGISQVMIRPTEIATNKPHKEGLSDSEILLKMDEEIEQIKALAGRKPTADTNREEPYMLQRNNWDRPPSPLVKHTEYDTASQETPSMRNKHFESFKSGTNTPQQQFGSNSRLCLMKVIINKTDVSVFGDDNSESIARRYFDQLGTVPLRRDFLKLQALVKEKVEKKIDHLEVMFKRPLARLEQQNHATHKPKMVSIDLSNKENKSPNVLTPIHKPPPGLPRGGAVGNKFGNKQDIPIPIKKDDDPEQLARVILIQRGLGLSRVSQLAEMIRQNQQRLFGMRGVRSSK